MRFSLILVVIGLYAPTLWANERASFEKLCAGYERKQAMLQRRLHVGARPWEKKKIQEQLKKLAADREKYCKTPTSRAGEHP